MTEPPDSAPLAELTPEALVNLRKAEQMAMLDARTFIAMGSIRGLLALPEVMRTTEDRLREVAALPIEPVELVLEGDDLRAVMIGRTVCQVIMKRDPTMSRKRRDSLQKVWWRLERLVRRSIEARMTETRPRARSKCPLGVLARDPEAMPTL